jgi:glutamate N-acetyltransferase/amino-acid N-acetyltransferase
MMEECTGGISAPKGFQAAGVHCGVKKKRKDLAIVASATPAVCAAVFTANKVQAAPLLVDKIQLGKSDVVRALVVNSGNANACTGEQGMRDAWNMVAWGARAMGVPEEQVLVSSTGVIGQTLPMEKICDGIRRAAACLSADAHTDAAEAIMTTDTFPKEVAVRADVAGSRVTLGGMAKGSGMIAPNMATMLAFVTTDAAIEQGLLLAALRKATDRSFNRITVDGDMSTNDMVVVMANGAAGNDTLASDTDPGYPAFSAALEHLLVRLSKMIVLDGEGATKFIEIRVEGGANEAEATQAARAIANSNLVKTAIHGEDANWGRILAAVGYSGIDFDPSTVEIFFGDLPILRKNYTVAFSEDAAAAVLGQKEIVVRVHLHRGTGAASFWTCDLSKEYVTINANYRT